MRYIGCMKRIFRKRKRERGYMMVMLLGTIMIMGILMTKAAPNLIKEMQREAEEEAIFRGESYAKAIRLYHANTQTYPLSLEDLIKARPPYIRKLYKDPLTQEGDWELITAVPAGASGDTTGLPIIGVRSKSQKDSVKLYRGKSMHSDWTFSATDDILGIMGGEGGVQGGFSTSTKPGETPGETPGEDAGDKK